MVHGRVISPDDADYDVLRSLFYGGVDRRPSRIVLAADAADVATVVRAAWVTQFAAALYQGDDGAYVNFLDDAGEAGVRAAYPGATWDRLTAIKARYDPTKSLPAQPEHPAGSGMVSPIETEGQVTFGQLDFLYTPSADVAADARYFSEVLGAELVFAIEAMGTKVAMVRLSSDGPAILLTDHLDGDRPILVYRVEDLAEAVAALEARGWPRGRMLELPPGPACSFETPGGHRLAVYELSRPVVLESFAGRRDF